LIQNLRHSTRAILLLLSGLSLHAATLACQSPGALPPHALRRIADVLHSKGFSGDPREAPPMSRTLGSRPPSYVPGLGSDGPRQFMWIQRDCPDSLRRQVHDCVRFDTIEAFAGPTDSLTGVIPLTFQGARAGYLSEVEPSANSIADAALVARAAHVHVFRPPPLPLLSTPGDSGH
jgi:hypothetical protein